MKYLKVIILASTLFVINSIFFSCKSKTETTSNGDTSVNAIPQADTSVTQPAPVQISTDDSLTMMAKDAVKDYPGVTTTINNGEVTMTGNISREKLPKLMMAISAIHPKKIVNNLTIK